MRKVLSCSGATARSQTLISVTASLIPCWLHDHTTPITHVSSLVCSNITQHCFTDILKGNATLILCGSQIVCFIYKITNFTISTSHYSQNRVIFKTFYLLIKVLKMDWILFTAVQLHILWWACLSLNVIGRYASLTV